MDHASAKIMNENCAVPVNKCIYCGTTEKTLTDEHIIAYGLSGNLILPKASCLDCNKITGLIEERVLRGFTQQARTALGLRTRRRNNAPKTFPLGIIKDGREKIIDVAVSEHCVVLPLPLFEPPAFMENNIPKPSRNYKEGIGLTGLVTVWLSDREQIRKRYNADEIFVEHKLDHLSFARMLAKIGYCQAIAQFGLDAIQEAYVLPAILGERNDIGRWVGSTDTVLTPEIGVGHQIHAEKWERVNHGNSQELIIAYIHLFSHLHSPLYTVIVGGKR